MFDAIIRVLLAILLALIALFAPYVHAALPPNACATPDMHCTKDAAQSACNAAIAIHAGNNPGVPNTWGCEVLIEGRWTAVDTRTHNGAGFNDAQETFFFDSTPCADRPPLPPGATRGTLTVCVDGCEYKPDTTGKRCLHMDPDSVAAGLLYCGSPKFTPTGNTCAVPKSPEGFDPDKDACGTINGGTYNECLKPDGEHCITAPSGKTLCWGPTDTGPRMTSGGDLGGNRQEQGGPTPNAPPGQKNPTQVGSSGVCVNSVCYITNTYTGNGNNGGQPNQGNGNGECQSSSPPAYCKPYPEPGKPAPHGAPLYTPTGHTAAQAFSDFQAQVAGSPAVDAARNFFVVSPSGACPALTLPASDFFPAMSFTDHCSGTLAQLLAYGGYVMMALAAFAAFRIAVY